MPGGAGSQPAEGAGEGEAEGEDEERRMGGWEGRKEGLASKSVLPPAAETSLSANIHSRGARDARIVLKELYTI